MFEYGQKRHEVKPEENIEITEAELELTLKEKENQIQFLKRYLTGEKNYIPHKGNFNNEEKENPNDEYVDWEKIEERTLDDKKTLLERLRADLNMHLASLFLSFFSVFGTLYTMEESLKPETYLTLLDGKKYNRDDIRELAENHQIRPKEFLFMNDAFECVERGESMETCEREYLIGKEVFSVIIEDLKKIQKESSTEEFLEIITDKYAAKYPTNEKDQKSIIPLLKKITKEYSLEYKRGQANFTKAYNTSTANCVARGTTQGMEIYEVAGDRFNVTLIGDKIQIFEDQEGNQWAEGHVRVGLEGKNGEKYIVDGTTYEKVDELPEGLAIEKIYEATDVGFFDNIKGMLNFFKKQEQIAQKLKKEEKKSGGKRTGEKRIDSGLDLTPFLGTHGVNDKIVKVSIATDSADGNETFVESNTKKEKGIRDIIEKVSAKVDKKIKAKKDKKNHPSEEKSESYAEYSKKQEKMIIPEISEEEMTLLEKSYNNIQPIKGTYDVVFGENKETNMGEILKKDGTVLFSSLKYLLSGTLRNDGTVLARDIKDEVKFLEIETGKIIAPTVDGIKQGEDTFSKETEELRKIKEKVIEYLKSKNLKIPRRSHLEKAGEKIYKFGTFEKSIYINTNAEILNPDFVYDYQQDTFKNQIILPISDSSNQQSLKAKGFSFLDTETGTKTEILLDEEIEMMAVKLLEDKNIIIYPNTDGNPIEFDEREGEYNFTDAYIFDLNNQEKITKNYNKIYTAEKNRERVILIERWDIDRYEGKMFNIKNKESSGDFFSKPDANGIFVHEAYKKEDFNILRDLNTGEQVTKDFGGGIYFRETPIPQWYILYKHIENDADIGHLVKINKILKSKKLLNLEK